MDAGTINLLKFLNGRDSVYRIPVYQRRYEWTEEQVNQYFYDIEKIALNNEYEGHFLGTVVFVKSSFQNMGTDFILIDGQQRITTTFLFLKAIYDALDELDNQRAIIHESYFINKYVDPPYERKLISVDDDRKDYEELLVHNKSDNPTKMHMNYRRLVYLIQHSEASVEELFTALSKVKIVYIELEQGKKDENPQTIFESLNSTGLSLTESDLIRNYLLMNEPAAQQEILYKNYWLRIENLLTNAKISDFIRDYLTMKTGTIPNKSKVYQSFKGYMQRHDIMSETILKDLNIFAEYYKMFLNADAKSEEVSECLDIILQLKSTVTYPYLLRLFHKFYYTKEISNAEFLSVLKYLSSYLVRRTIVNSPTNSLNKVFSSIGKEIDKKDSEMPEGEAFVDFLMERVGSSIFPRDEKLRDGIRNNDIYNRNHKLAKMVLSKIEMWIHKEYGDFQPYQIEHILPNTLTSAWRVELGKNAIYDHELYKDVLGNLTLTRYNAEMSNSSFEKKKAFYAESNVKLTRDLSEWNQWNKKSIEQRGKFLFEQIIEIWPLPADNYSKEKQEKLETDVYYQVFEVLNVTGEKPQTLKVEDQDLQVTSWRNMLLTYLEWLGDFDLEAYQNLPKQRAFQKLLSYDPATFPRKEELLGVYINTNLNAQTIYDYVGSLAEYYGMEDEVAVQLV